jgi:hypothetical protein
MLHKSVIDCPLSDCIQVSAPIPCMLAKIEVILCWREVYISITHYALSDPIHTVEAVIVTISPVGEERVARLVEALANYLLLWVSMLVGQIVSYGHTRQCSWWNTST